MNRRVPDPYNLPGFLLCSNHVKVWARFAPLRSEHARHFEKVRSGRNHDPLKLRIR